MIKDVSFQKYRGFTSYRASLSPSAYLIGPNSAGKSTIIETLGLADACIRHARRRRPLRIATDRGRSVRGFSLPDAADTGVDDPVHFDFMADAARVSVRWSSGAKLHIVWPSPTDDAMADPTDDDSSPYYWLETEGGTQPSQAEITGLYPVFSVIPVITPLDAVEELKNEKYVRKMAGTRLASRHFRNNLRLSELNGEFDAFIDFSKIWLPEISIENVTFDVMSDRLAVFYTEGTSRVPKELAWAGDGMQIWLQLLWHLHRAQDAATIVLDEPEVYLHPDLQRRLVRLLDDSSAQVILASHSSEVIREAAASDVVWVDRKRTRTKRIRDNRSTQMLYDSIGSNYNLTLVGSLRSKAVVAAEGDTARPMRLLAKAVGARNFATETNISIVPVQNFGSWLSFDPLIWMAHELLTEVPNFAVWMGSRGDSARDTDVSKRLASHNINTTIWSARQFQNFLLQPLAMSRVSQTDTYAMTDQLEAAVESEYDEAREWYLGQGLHGAREKVTSDNPQETCNPRVADFERLWGTTSLRVGLVSWDRVLGRLNTWLAGQDYRQLTAEGVARAMKSHEVPDEIVTAVYGIEELVIG